MKRKPTILAGLTLCISLTASAQINNLVRSVSISSVDLPWTIIKLDQVGKDNTLLVSVRGIFCTASCVPAVSSTSGGCKKLWVHEYTRPLKSEVDYLCAVSHAGNATLTVDYKQIGAGLRYDILVVEQGLPVTEFGD